MCLGLVGAGDGLSGGWAGGVDRTVGESQGELAVGSESDVPVVVVDVGVVDAADGQEVVEVGVAAVAPPGDVVEFAAVVGDGAAGDRTAAVEAAQGAALGAVGEAGVASEVQFAGCVQHDAVAHDDGVDVGVTGEGGQDAGGDLAGDGVERGGQVPHAFGIHPGLGAHVAALAGQAVHAVIGLQAFGLQVQAAGERTAEIRPTRSTTPATSIHPTINKGCHRVARAGSTRRGAAISRIRRGSRRHGGRGSRRLPRRSRRRGCRSWPGWRADLARRRAR